MKEEMIEMRKAVEKSVVLNVFLFLCHQSHSNFLPTVNHKNISGTKNLYFLENKPLKSKSFVEVYQ